jgi:hypothetical protein
MQYFTRAQSAQKSKVTPHKEGENQKKAAARRIRKEDKMNPQRRRERGGTTIEGQHNTPIHVVHTIQT